MLKLRYRSKAEKKFRSFIPLCEQKVAMVSPSTSSTRTEKQQAVPARPQQAITTQIQELKTGIIRELLTVGAALGSRIVVELSLLATVDY
jgi:hypothetical protein